MSADTMIVFLADVWLDSEKVYTKYFTELKRKLTVKIENKVMEKLQTLFIGYSDCPPYAFVFCGNFLSQPKYGLRCDEFAGKYFTQLFFKFALMR